MFGAILSKGCLVFIVCLLVVSSGTATAAPLIAQVKTGDTGYASREYISIYNNSDEPVDVTGWCLQYASSSDATKTKLACLSTDDELVGLYLEPYGYARFASQEFSSEILDFVADGSFAAGMAAASGHIRLLDNTGLEKDKLGWGSAVSPMVSAAAAHSTGYILQRKSIEASQLLQNTGNNQADFAQSLLESIPSSGLYEVELTDSCLNISGVQSSVPDGHTLDGDGNCLQDVCLNLDGIQESLPENYEFAVNDTCQELPQISYPKILITELLPNVAGVDTGKEFIELYNPNSSAVELENYRLELNSSSPKGYALPQLLLDPFSYVSFSDLITGLTLPNTSASVRLFAPNDAIVSETDAYDSPKDDESWALINNVWQYTSLVTAGLPNKADVSVGGLGAVSQDDLEDCGPGKFRNPETNRCKNIDVDDTELKPCTAGQERNPDTNRCRNISSSDGLTPCREGQERNPETNRCRSVVTASSALVPCAPGQERNPETNRCRKVDTLGASTLSDVQDIPSETANVNSWNWLAVGAIGLALLTYGIYEWRGDIKRFISNLGKPKVR